MFDNWNEFAESEFEINGKIYRNIQAQVQENMDDIKELQATGLPTAEITAKLNKIDQEIASLNAADGELAGQIGDLSENKVSVQGDTMSGSLVNTGGQQGSIPTDSCELSKFGLRSTGRNLVFTTKEMMTVQRATADSRGRTIPLKGIRADNDPTSAVCLSQLNIRLAPAVGELIPATGC